MAATRWRRVLGLLLGISFVVHAHCTPCDSNTSDCPVSTIYMVGTTPIEPRPTSVVNIEFSSTSVVNPRPTEFSPTSVVNPRPTESSSTSVVNSRPTESSSTSVVNSRPTEFSPTSVVNPRPTESSPTSVVNTRPTESSPTSVVNTRPTEFSPTSALMTRPTTSTPVSTVEIRSVKLTLISNSVSLTVCGTNTFDLGCATTQIAFSLSSLAVLVILVSCLFIVASIWVRTLKKKRPKLTRSNQRPRAPTVLSLDNFQSSSSIVDLGLQETNVDYSPSGITDVDGQYEFTDDLVDNSLLRVVSNTGPGVSPPDKESCRPLCGTNGLAHLEFEFSDSTVADNIYHRRETMPNEYQDDVSKSYQYEQLYFEPANCEEHLLEQLKKLGIQDIPEEKLRTKECLGSGQFGIVYKGLCQLSSQPQLERKRTEVAVKTLESNSEKVRFLQEAVVMGQFNHPNILSILGFVSKDPMRIVMTLMHNGDLKQYLTTFKPSTGESVIADLTPLLLSFSRQVSIGMMYLAFKEYVHRNLAARNVFISKNGVCKVADFGLSQQIGSDEHYLSHGGKIPVKWTAPEALNHHKYSTASDVWSYGCLLYEIWSLGEKPYGVTSNSEVIRNVMTGYRLPPPPGCPRTVYETMIKCWDPDPQHRISIPNIVVTFTQAKFQVLRWSEEDVSRYSTVARTIGGRLEEGHSMYESLQATYISNNLCA